MAPILAEAGTHVLLQVFTLASLGIDPARFVCELAPSFDALPWDLYDVKRAQVERLLAHFPAERPRLERFLADYFAGRASLAQLSELVQRLPEHEQRTLDALAPTRRRAIAHFLLERRGDGWTIRRQAVASFSQASATPGDYRTLPRTFAPLAKGVAEHPLFQQWLRAVGDQVRTARPEAERLQVACHQMRSVASPGRRSSNAPEGIHQDGADYIVSALVVERRGVAGGESRVYDENREVLLRRTLEIGEGLFQADAGSPLWHDVTSIAFDPESGECEGVRSIFGLDIRLA